MRYFRVIFLFSFISLQTGCVVQQQPSKVYGRIHIDNPILSNMELSLSFYQQIENQTLLIKKNNYSIGLLPLYYETRLPFTPSKKIPLTIHAELKKQNDLNIQASYQGIQTNSYPFNIELQPLKCYPDCG